MPAPRHRPASSMKAPLFVLCRLHAASKKDGYSAEYCLMRIRGRRSETAGVSDGSCQRRRPSVDCQQKLLDRTPEIKVVSPKCFAPPCHPDRTDHITAPQGIVKAEMLPEHVKWPDKVPLILPDISTQSRDAPHLGNFAKTSVCRRARPGRHSREQKWNTWHRIRSIISASLPRHRHCAAARTAQDSSCLSMMHSDCDKRDRMKCTRPADQHQPSRFRHVVRLTRRVPPLTQTASQRRPGSSPSAMNNSHGRLGL